MSSTATLKAVATGTAVASEAKNPVARFKSILEAKRGDLVAALPRHITPDRMIRLATTEFAKNPKLAECTPVSVYGSIIQAAQLGVEIGVMGQGYLVPYQKSTKQGDRWVKSLECQFIIGYKGLIGLARRSGEVTSIETNIVYANDKFMLKLGLDTQLEHEPTLDGERGNIRLVYGVAKFRDGGHHFEWMTLGDIMKIKARSKSADNGPWVTDFEQMARKTLIRRMANYLPMSIELAAAIQLSEAQEAGQQARVEKTLDGDLVVHVDDDGVIGGESQADAAGGQDAGAELDRQQQKDLDAATTGAKPAATGGDKAHTGRGKGTAAPTNAAGSAPFTLQDALAVVAKGQYAEARDMVKGAPFTDIDRAAVEGAIAERTESLRADATGGDQRPEPPVEA